MAQEAALMKSAELGQIHQVNNYISNYILLVKKQSWAMSPQLLRGCLLSQAREADTFGCLSSPGLAVKAFDGLSWQLTRAQPTE